MPPNPGDVPIFVGPEWTTGPVPASPQTLGAIIYQPGGVSAGDTVATWAEVQTFIAATHGKCVVYVDDSITSPAPVPGTSGITECFGRVTVQPYKVDSIIFTVLEVEDGATLSNLYEVIDLELRLNC